MLRRIVLAGLCSLLFFGLFSPASADAPDALARIKKAGVLRIGVKSTVPGIGFANPAKGGAYEGFEIDIARGIAKSILGDPAKVQFVPVATADRIPRLRKGDIDAIVATMTITTERMAQVDFSEVYFKAGQALLVKAGSPINGFRDLDGKRVCTARGSTSDSTLRMVAPKAQVVLKERYGDCYDALKSGAVDAMSTDNVILLGFWQSDDKGFTHLPQTFTAEPYGIGIPKGADSLRAAVNDALRAFRRSGDYDRSYVRWMHQPLPRNYGFWIGMSPDRAAQLYAQHANP